MGQVSGQTVAAAVSPTLALIAYVGIAGGRRARRHPGTGRAGMTFSAAFLATWRAILTSRTLLSTMLLAVVLYAFYYPAPYAHEAPRKLPVVVVDQDASALSRAMIRDLDATRAIHVVAVADDLSAARADMRSGKADGIILISDGLERSCGPGRPDRGSRFGSTPPICSAPARSARR